VPSCTAGKATSSPSGRREGGEREKIEDDVEGAAAVVKQAEKIMTVEENKPEMSADFKVHYYHDGYDGYGSKKHNKPPTMLRLVNHGFGAGLMSPWICGVLRLRSLWTGAARCPVGHCGVRLRVGW